MRTNIIAADGTNFRQEGSTRRILRRAIIGGAIILALIFISAAVIGLTRASTDDHSPSRASLTALHKAEARGAKNCRLEWNAAQDDHEVICDPAKAIATYNDGWVDATQALRDLAARPAHSTTQADGSIVDDPAGADLIAECLADPIATTAEVMGCLAQ
jgi:hypothetical protein